MLAALAEFERELILERTRAGIARARALGKKFGAPRRIPESTAREIVARRVRGESLRGISQQMNVKLGAVRSVLKREPSRLPRPAAPARSARGYVPDSSRRGGGMGLPPRSPHESEGPLS